MRCPRCQHDNRPTARFCEDCANPFNGAIPTTGSYAHLKAEVETLRGALSESLEQQMATTEILRVISSSPTDVQPVLDTIGEHAARLCGSYDAAVYLVHEDRLRLVAHHGPVPVHVAGHEMPLSREFVAGRTVIDRRPIHVDDLSTSNEFPGGRRLALEVGYRTVLTVPLLRQGVGIGMVGIRRREVQPFTDKETALLETFAAQAVIAIENVRLFAEREARNADLKIALDQQIATGEILRVISSSPTNEQPVFDAIVQHARRLCEASYSGVFLVKDNQLVMAAADGIEAAGIDAIHGAYPRPVARDTTSGRAILDRAIIHLEDSWTDPAYTHPLRDIIGLRSILTVPIFRDGLPIGAVSAWRPEARPFTDKQIVLLQTFAEQAVIALENVRLFTELQQKNNALTQANAQVSEALEQQTATSEILRVMSSSPTDIQPVFDTIIERSVRLCDARLGALLRFDGQMIHLAAHAQQDAESLQALQTMYPMPANTAGVSGRALLSGTSVHVRDMRDDPELAQAPTAQVGHRTVLSVPMMREGAPIGVITVARARVEPFSDRQVELLQTFADQAVIAIENVRLFTELQASNRELTTALDTQTATSEILRVISRSQTDVQPVFEAILASAVRLLGGYSGTVTRVVGDQIEIAALISTDATGDAAQRERYPQSLRSGGSHATAIRNRTPFNIADTQTDPGLPEPVRAFARVRGYRGLVVVPLLRQDEVLGAISVTRREAGGFTNDEITLLQTFSDQAVIAIENARLLSELQARTTELTRSVDELTALGDVGRALSSTLDLETVLQTIVTRANQLTGTAGCTIWEYDEAREEFRLRASHYADEGDAAMLQAPGRVNTIHRGQGVTSRVMERREPVQIRDIAAKDAYESPIRQPLIEAGHRALLGVPLLSEDAVIGVLAVTRKSPGEFEPETVRLLSTFATQSALAIQNARLFLEIEDKGRQLEAASQHKSEFLANMSHELRTPLNAIIGFSEVLSERMFGELNEKQEEYLRDIHTSGQHLLSLINDILDLSKIEAGRMELELADFHLPSAVENALILVRERATRRGIALGHTIDSGLGMVQADERKVKQVLLNLLSNALKFTPEGGRVDVRAGVRDDLAEVSVSDTGVGIAPEDQEAVFEEFRQVGTADKKVEGTGLGLALSRKFVELHGGQIWVRSQVGEGSTFTFTLPVRREEEMGA